MAELEKEHQDWESELLAQISDLEDRVRSYEERLDELSSTNSGLHQAMRNQEAGVKARVDVVQRPLDAALQHQTCDDLKFDTNSKCPLCNPSQSQNHCCDLHNVVDTTVP
jgi:hypothetical protein